MIKPKNLSECYDDFWKKVEKTDGCWLWKSSRTRGGLGHGRTAIHGKNYLTHRITWMMFNGKIPDGLCVCHKCDVPHCVNPDHLFLGTIKENAWDMITKGRAAYRKPTTCNRGHDLSDVNNVYIYPSGKKRCCNVCKKMGRKYVKKELRPIDIMFPLTT